MYFNNSPQILTKFRQSNFHFGCECVRRGFKLPVKAFEVCGNKVNRTNGADLGLTVVWPRSHFANLGSFNLTATTY